MEYKSLLPPSNLRNKKLKYCYIENNKICTPNEFVQTNCNMRSISYKHDKKIPKFFEFLFILFCDDLFNFF